MGVKQNRISLGLRRLSCKPSKAERETREEESQQVAHSEKTRMISDGLTVNVDNTSANGAEHVQKGLSGNVLCRFNDVIARSALFS
jgi:hypothetical protein